MWKLSLQKTTFDQIFLKFKKHVKVIFVTIRIRLSQRRFSRSKSSLKKKILNQSIFQINIIRIMFGPKKKHFLASLAPVPHPQFFVFQLFLCLLVWNYPTPLKCFGFYHLQISSLYSCWVTIFTRCLHHIRKDVLISISCSAYANTILSCHLEESKPFCVSLFSKREIPCWSPCFNWTTSWRCWNCLLHPCQLSL